MNQQPIIKVRNLTKFYGDFTALKGLDFTIYPGEIFGFLGPNGAGKTTTIKTLIGLLQPSSGTCQILGQNPYGNKEIYLKIGVVFEESTLYGRLSGRQNLMFYARLFDISSERVEHLLSRLGLQQAASRRVDNYSKGMKQRLLIGRALLHEPRILILDEPTGGLDPNSANSIRRMIGDFQKQGKTIFLTTHDMEEAEELCDRVAFINQGQIRIIDRTDKLKQKYGRPRLAVSLFTREGQLAEDIQKFLAPEDDYTLEGNHLTVYIPLQSPSLENKLYKFRQNFDIDSIHTQEASLAEVFRQINQLEGE